MTDYGQRREMEDASMVGTLAAQAELIWPIERPLLERLGVPGARRLLDLGCGTGEITARVAATWPSLEVTGLDLCEAHLEVARRRARPGAENPRWIQGDAYATGLPAAAFDVVLVRHLLHALPERAALLAEARRVLRGGGLLYVLAEDYQGLVFDAPDEAASLFLDARRALLPAGTDLFHGRAAWRELCAAGFADVGSAPILVDVQDGRRETLARMLAHWRDGYAGLIATRLGADPMRVAARFDGLIEAARDPGRYACWLSFAVWGRAS